MSQSLVLDVKGLYTYSSDIAGVPPGTLAVADNVNITRLNVIEPRRGFEYFYNGATITTFGLSTDRIKKFVFWKDEVFGHYGSSFALFSPSTGTNARGTLITPTNATSIKYVNSSNKNLYVTNSTGLLKTDTTSNSLFAAGMPKALNLFAEKCIYPNGSSTVGTAVLAGKSVSYVYLIGRRDENGIYVYSSPSGRTTYSNNDAAALSRNVSLLLNLPPGLDNSYFIQLYRTIGSSSTATGEEYQLAYEKFLSSTNGVTLTITQVQRTNNYVTIITSANTNFVSGQKVTVNCTTAGMSSLNGTFTIIAGPDADEFSYYQNGIDIAVTSAAGSVTTQSDVDGLQTTITDITPDNLLGSYIYTAPSQEGIAKQNNYPPLATDIAEYQNCLFYADVSQKHGLEFELVTTAIFAGITITIGSEIYTGEAYADYPNRIFKIARPLVKISTVAKAGNTVTIVTQRAHGLKVSESVKITTNTHTFLNGTYSVATVSNSTTFTYTLSPGANISPAESDTGYIEHDNLISSASIIRQLTMLDFVSAVNLNSSGSYFGFSISEGQNDSPGKVFIEARTFATNQFSIVSSEPSFFQPNLLNPANQENTSDNNAYRNGLMYSKPQEPEHVPVLNIFFCGNADKPIKRIWGSRDVLFIFKEDGTWILRGETEANFTLNQLDLNAKIFAPDSLVSVNNNLYALMESGIAEITDTGVSVISYPIRDQLLQLYAANKTNNKLRSFGIGNDTEGKYILSIVEDNTSAYTTKQIVFDVFSRLFCGNWFQTVTAGGLNPADGKLYFGPNENRIRKEFKTFLPQDFADEYQTISIVSAVGLNLTLSTAQGISVNDVLKQGSIYAYITSIDQPNNTCTVDTIESWTSGTSDVIHYKAIDVHVEWNSDFAGNPAGSKHYYELVLLQKSAFLNTARWYFKNDLNQAESYIDIEANGYSGIFGDSVWGDTPFGGDIFNTPVRCGIPRTHARCSQLRVRFDHSVAYSDFQITGISLSYNPTSTRVVR